MQGKKSKVIQKRLFKRITSALLIAVLTFIAFVGIIFGINKIAVNNITNYARSFYSVEYPEDRLVPEIAEDGYWTFTSNSGIKIMQITDLHLRGSTFYPNFDKAVLNAVAAMVLAEKPDLLIATGDIVQATIVSGVAVDNLDAYKVFFALLEKLGVYWTFTFGNHDTEPGTLRTREYLSDYINDANFNYCLFLRGPEDIYGFGNNVIKVVNFEGVITQAIITMDSNDYVKPLGDYDHIHEDQIIWYENIITELNNYNANALENADIRNLTAHPDDYLIVPSLLFMHIPLKEYDDAWDEYERNGLSNTLNVTYFYGDKLEEVCYAQGEEDNMFESILAKGSTKGIFCGHEHINDFSIEYMGIRLSYSKSIRYTSLKPSLNKGFQRGCTIIETEDTGKWNSYTENFYQDKYITLYPKEEANMEI